MIAQKYRFHGHGSLRYVLSRGESERNKMLAIKWVKNPRRKHSRLAVVVSKKVYKSAVKRNRIRRRIYELIRLHLADSNATDIVVSVYSPEILTVSRDELAIMILPLLQKAGLKSRKIHS